MINLLLLKIFGLEQEDEQKDIELICVPEEIYFQLTEIEQELPFDV